MTDLCLVAHVIDHRQAFIHDGPYICLSLSDWDHKETSMDQTQKGPLYTTLSILTPEKLLSLLSQGKALLAAQLVTARATDRVWQGFVQSESATDVVICCHSSLWFALIFTHTL